jgi:hypothetical protein
MPAEKVITPEFRASWVNLFTPQENKREDGTVTRSYSVTAIFPKDTDLSVMKAEAHKVLVDEFGADQAKWPEGMRSPFRRCKERWKNEKGVVTIPEGFEDGEAIFVALKASEKSKPGLVDQNVQDIIEPRDLYSGCYCRASARPYFYSNKGNRGVAFGLNNVQKLRDGDPLGGKSRPTDDFKPVEGAMTASTGAAGLFD